MNKTVASSRVEMTQVVLPQFANSHGTAFGGQVLAWIDICAAVAAARHANLPVVTVSMDAIHFVAPIKQGHVVVLKGQVNAAFNTSMECGVAVYGENPLTGEKFQAARAYTTFVAVGMDGKPVQVPKLILETEEDLKRAEAAMKRREQRLLSRNLGCPIPKKGS